MDEKKVKVKYILNFWKTLPDYPTQEDVLYEISYYLEKDGRANGEFSETTLEFIFRNSTKKELKSINASLEILKKAKDIIVIKETGADNKKWFKIANNPFIDADTK